MVYYRLASHLLPGRIRACISSLDEYGLSSPICLTALAKTETYKKDYSSSEPCMEIDEYE